MFYEISHLGSPDYLKIEKNENFSFPPHLHQCFEIIIIKRGMMNIIVDGNSFILQGNEALLIFPNQIHSLESTDSEHLLCIFSPRLVQAYSTRVTEKKPINNKFYPDDYLINALDKLDINSSTAEKKGVLYSLCAQFDKTANYALRRTDDEKLLFKMFSFVEEQFCNDCSLEALAENIGYNYSYLSRYFKKIVGISFNAYVNHYRLSHACYLLENSDTPILQCAYESGYISLRSFNRNFKDYFKITPVQYRRNIKNGA